MSLIYMMVKRLIILMIFAVGAFSCEEDEISMELTKLEKQKMVWQLNKPTNYSYRIFKTCLCPLSERGPYKVTINENQVTDIQYLGIYPTEKPISEVLQMKKGHLQLDSLFNTMQLHFLKKPDKVLIDYDPLYGYPAEVSIDFIRTSTDDELGIFISNFELLEDIK